MTSPMRLKAMHKACETGDLKKARLMLRAGVPADGSWDDRPFVRTAACAGHLQMSELLLEAGADLRVPNLLRWVASSERGNLAVLEPILALGPEQKELNEALTYAIFRGNQWAVERLTQAGAVTFKVSPEDRLRCKLAPARRTAWLPRVDPGESTGSTFGGIPWLEEGEEWPRCGHCHQPMQLLLQLDLPNTPLAEVCGQGTLQVFYCTTPDTYCEQAGDDAFSPFGAFLLARMVQIESVQSLAEDLVPDPLPAVSIVGWRTFHDHPTAEEPDAHHGISLDEDELDELLELQEESEWNDQVLPITWHGDKLLGWPIWLQDYEETPCPECGEPMRYLLQIASNDHLAYTFGDAGVARVMQCEAHPGRLGFSWAGR